MDYIRDLTMSYVKNLTSDFASKPIVESWFMMSSPLPSLFIMALYLYFVLIAGPRYMAKRKPFNLNKILIVYNLSMVVINAWIVLPVLKLPVIPHILQMDCKPFDSQYDFQVASFQWWYFITKYIDLLDTIFFVLRKKHHQVTFLHVYHHFIMVILSWLFVKYFPGETGLFYSIINSTVHIIMYFYYMVSAMGPKYQKYIWWKKHLTMIQLVQFIMFVTYAASQFYIGCHMPRVIIYFLLANIVLFFYLFAVFYVKKYRQNITIGNNSNAKVLKHME